MHRFFFSKKFLVYIVLTISRFHARFETTLDVSALSWADTDADMGVESRIPGSSIRSVPRNQNSFPVSDLDSDMKIWTMDSDVDSNSENLRVRVDSTQNWIKMRQIRYFIRSKLIWYPTELAAIDLYWWFSRPQSPCGSNLIDIVYLKISWHWIYML